MNKIKIIITNNNFTNVLNKELPKLAAIVFKLHSLRINLNSINKTNLWKIKLKLVIKLKKNLVLTGMMGVGKSTIGKNLANKLSYTHIDIDKIIEEKGNHN